MDATPPRLPAEPNTQGLSPGLWAGLLVALAAGLAYAPTLGHDFAFDEYFLVLEDTTLHSLRNLPAFFTRPFWPGQTGLIYYRPLITALYALDYSLGHGRPWPFHLTNLLGHVLASLLAWQLARKLFPRIATISALFFALHPVHTETVSWISGRTDLFAALFVFLAWILALEPGSPFRVKPLLALPVFFLALLAKEVAVVFPVLLFLGDRLQSRRLDFNRLLYFGLLAAPLLAYFYLRHQVLAIPGPAPAANFFADHSWTFRIFTMSGVAWTYLRLLCFPYPLRLDYYYDQFFKGGVGTGIGIAAVAGLVLLAVGAAAGWKRRPGVAFDFLGLTITLLPMSHLITFPTLMAERFLYLPSFFTCLFLARAVDLTRARSPRWAVGLAGLAALELLGLTAGRNRVWRDGYHYWRAAVRQIPERPEGHNLLGIFAESRGEFRLARHEYEAALLLDSDYTTAEMNLAGIPFRQGDWPEARRLLEDVVRKTPDLEAARFNLGMVYRNLGEMELAIAEFQAGLKLFPANLQMRLSLIAVLEKEGRSAEARQAVAEGLALQPDQPELLRLKDQL